MPFRALLFLGSQRLPDHYFNLTLVILHEFIGNDQAFSLEGLKLFFTAFAVFKQNLDGGLFAKLVSGA